MNELWIGLLGVLLATNQPVALSNLVAATTGLQISVPNPNDAVEIALRQIMRDDDAAQDEVDRWIQENDQFKAQGAGVEDAALNERIRTRLERVRSAYQDFLRQHPRHARGYLAYASFLNDIHEEEHALPAMEKARELDPKNPATWNNLANYYGHFGPVTNAFAFYAKAIELDPTEPVYHQNFATTLFLFRKDAREFYQIEEQEVFNRSLRQYAMALELAPASFLIATDLAQSYYGIKPDRFDDAIAAWNTALRLAGNEVERQGVLLHLARNRINSGRLAEARKDLAEVNLAEMQVLKDRLTRKLAEREAEARSTAAPVNTAPKGAN